VDLGLVVMDICIYNGLRENKKKNTPVNFEENDQNVVIED